VRGGRAGVAAALVAVLCGVGGLAACERHNGTAQPSPGVPGSVAAPGEFSPGAAGIGDPYFPAYGNGGYDVAHYHLEIRYNPSDGRLDGYAVITASATQDLNRFNLDFSQLAVSELTVDGAPAGWKPDGEHELVVTPAAGLAKGREFTVAVRYSGVPGKGKKVGDDGFVRTTDGAVVAGEPEAATDWFPVNDHPRDKATYDLAVTVPDGLSAVANGILDGSSSDAGWTTWRWSEHAPMASYLATVAIGHFRVVSDVHNGLPVYTAVAASLPADKIDPVVARTPEIVDFLATQFGPYPFDAMGAIVPDLALDFALETQTRPVYAPRFFTTNSGADPSTILAHELAHQWYGDSVSVQNWRDIWLNEGFATYAEWLWDEHRGRRSVGASFDAAYSASSTSQVWRPAPGDPGADHLFGGSVYQRGAMTLQALRVAVGDTAFFTILRSWAQEKRFGNASTAEFSSLAERVAGRPLKTLFDTWLFSEAKPAHP